MRSGCFCSKNRFTLFRKHPNAVDQSLMLGAIAVMKDDLPRLQKYLRKMFNTEALKLVMPGRKTDMAEVFVRDEQIATLSRDEEDGEVCYYLQMAILDIDLEDA